jgi:hypothetical protein
MSGQNGAGRAPRATPALNGLFGPLELQLTGAHCSTQAARIISRRLSRRSARRRNPETKGFVGSGHTRRLSRERLTFVEQLGS